MKYFKYISLICCLVFFKESYTQKDTIIIIKEIEQDHPLEISGDDLFDLDELLRRSDKAHDSTRLLLYSIEYFLKNDTILDISLKNELIESLDSLNVTFVKYLESAQKIEYLSYGKGRQAGIRSLWLKIMFQEEFLKYLKYWANSFYYVYLEPGVIRPVGSDVEK